MSLQVSLVIDSFASNLFLFRAHVSDPEQITALSLWFFLRVRNLFSSFSLSWLVWFRAPSNPAGLQTRSLNVSILSFLNATSSKAQQHVVIVCVASIRDSDIDLNQRNEMYSRSGAASQGDCAIKEDQDSLGAEKPTRVTQTEKAETVLCSCVVMLVANPPM